MEFYWTKSPMEHVDDDGDDVVMMNDVWCPVVHNSSYLALSLLVHNDASGRCLAPELIRPVLTYFASFCLYQ